MLSKQERKLRHLAAAEYLATAFDDEEEVAEILAFHYLSAYDAAREAEDAQQIRHGQARCLRTQASVLCRLPLPPRRSATSSKRPGWQN